MVKTNKTAQILRYISRKKFCSLADLTQKDSLLALFANTRSTTPKRRIIDACSILAKKGYISVGVVDNDKIFKITEKGLRHLKRAAVLEAKIESPVWDGRWYIVTFDIPESSKNIRNQIILCLKRHGFYNYTKGLWLYPHNPAKLLSELRDQYNLKAELMLIVAMHVDSESKLKKHFKL